MILAPLLLALLPQAASNDGTQDAAPPGDATAHPHHPGDAPSQVPS